MAGVLTEFSWGNLIKAAAIVGAIGVGITLTSGSKAQDEAQFLMALANTARGFASTDPDATNVTAANLIATNKIDSSRYSGTSTLIGKFGGTMTVGTITYVSGSDGFTFTETVPSSECESLAKALGGAVASMSIAGTAVKSYGSPAFSTATATTKCNSASTVAMIFGWTVK